MLRCRRAGPASARPHHCGEPGRGRQPGQVSGASPSPRGPGPLVFPVPKSDLQCLGFFAFGGPHLATCLQRWLEVVPVAL